MVNNYESHEINIQFVTNQNTHACLLTLLSRCWANVYKARHRIKLLYNIDNFGKHKILNSKFNKMIQRIFKNCIIFFSLIKTLNCAYQTIFIPMESQAVCSNYVLRDYVHPIIAASHEKIILVNISPHQTQYHDNILQKLHTEFVLIVNNGWKQRISLDVIGHKISFYILFVEHLFEVSETIKQWKSSSVTWNPLARVFIFISDSSDTDWKLRLILQIFLENHMINVDIIRKIENADIIEVVTWFPYADGSCGTHIHKLEMIGRCDMSSSEKSKKFQIARPKIPFNMGNCTVLVTGIEWAPFVHQNRRTSRNCGSEIHMIAAISSKLNIFIQYKIIDTQFRDNMTAIYAELEER